jgi:hypothetical protein
MLAWTATAMADDPLVDQYTEQVPTASGSQGTHSGGGGTGSAPLPTSVQTQIEQQGGSDGTVLKKITTSPQYGAPAVHPPDEGLSTPSSPNAVSAAVSAVADGSDARLIGLFIALLVTAALMLGAAASRRNRRVTP